MNTDHGPWLRKLQAGGVSSAWLQDEKELHGEGAGQGQEGKTGWGSSVPVPSVSGCQAQETPHGDRALCLALKT